MAAPAAHGGPAAIYPADTMNQRFQGRTRRRSALAGLLQAYADPATLLLAISAEGLGLASDVAHELGAAFDVLAVHPLELPCDDHPVIGAVTSDGTSVVEQGIVDLIDIEGEACQTLLGRAQAKAAAMEWMLREGGEPAEVAGRRVVVIDTCIADSCAVYAACLALKKRGAREIVVATPVISSRAIEELDTVAAEIVAVTVEEDVDEDASPPPSAGLDGELRWMRGGAFNDEHN